MKEFEKACTNVCISPQICKTYHYTAEGAIVDCSQNYRNSIKVKISL